MIECWFIPPALPERFQGSFRATRQTSWKSALKMPLFSPVWVSYRQQLTQTEVSQLRSFREISRYLLALLEPAHLISIYLHTRLHGYLWLASLSECLLVFWNIPIVILARDSCPIPIPSSIILMQFQNLSQMSSKCGVGWTRFINVPRVWKMVDGSQSMKCVSKMTSFCHHFTKNWTNGFWKKSVLEVVNLFELNEVDSIRYGLKMTNFCHHLTQNWMTGFQKRPFWRLTNYSNWMKLIWFDVVSKWPIFVIF